MAQNEEETPSWLVETPPAPAPVPAAAAATPPASKTFADETGTNVPAAAAPSPAPAAAQPSDNPEEMSAEDREALNGVIMFMRLANLAVSITIIVQASIKLTFAFAMPQYWVLCFYSACGGLLICCLETQLSFIRTSIALNFGFLFNPVLRFVYYILLATICYSLNDLFGKITAGCLVGVAFYNTYVLMKYPAYRKMRDQIAKEEDARINAAIRERVRKEAGAAMFSSANK